MSGAWTRGGKGVGLRASSLAVRLFLSVFIVGAGLTVVLGFVNVAQDYRAGHAELQAMLDAIERSYVPAVAQGLFEFNTDQLELLLEGIVLLRHVESASVIEARRGAVEIVASRGTTPSGEYIDRRFALSIHYGGEDRELGWLEIQASDAQIRRMVRDRLGLLVLSGGVQVFTVALLIWLVLEYSVVRHLRHIASYVRSIRSPADGVPRLELHRRELPDELADIVIAMNSANARVADGHNRLSNALEQKDTLLQELYHRTKNNMQLIVAMLDMRAARSPDNEQVRDLALDVRTRVYAMAIAHEKLYQARDLSRILIGEYLTDLAAAVSRSLASGRLDCSVRADETRIMLDTAVPLGLVVSELISNSIRHAYTTDEYGEIRIDFSAERDGTLRLRYTDDGVGMPAGFDPRQDAGVGLRTVVALVESQLDGTIRFDAGDGFACSITFVDDRYAERV